MTTTTTALSIEKTAALLQNLVDLKAQTGIAFPSIIDECVNELLDAQTAFVKKIDKYMHRRKHDVNEVETVKVIIETCPDFMATIGIGGRLPIHCSAIDDSSSHIFVPLLADMGHRHGVGGTDGRGGLLVIDYEDFSTLDYLTENPSPDAYKALMKMEPPLFYKQDIHDHDLLHHAVYDGHIEVVKLMVELDASCLYSSDRYDHMPIAYSCYSDKGKIQQLEILQYLLQAAINHDAEHPSIGGLFSKDDDNVVALKGIIDRFGENDAWDGIQQAISRFDTLPILHQTIIHAPQYCSAVLIRFPDSVIVRDDRNRLPIHVALESGMTWSPDLVSIINASRPHLKENDPVTGWPPFVLASMEPSCGLMTSFYLLKKHPEHGEKMYKDDENDNQSQEGNSNAKRRRMNK